MNTTIRKIAPHEINEHEINEHEITEYDVLVVGAGPAGLTLAISLAGYGIGVLVVDKHRGTSPFPKATGVSTRTMEILRGWGLEEAIRAGGMDVAPHMAIARTLREPAFATVPFGYPSAEEARSLSPTAPAVVPQDHVEPVLLAHLLTLGGRVAFDTSLVMHTSDEAGVVADLREVRSGRRTRVRARYLVGADGPRSLVRRRAGIGIEDVGTLGQFLAVTFRADLTRHLDRPRPALTAVQVPEAEGMVVTTSNDDRWIYAREWHPERGEEVEDYTPARLRALLRAGTGFPDLHLEVTSVLPFAMGAHVADTFRAGRTLLVGDAAHRTTPVGGVGMNIAVHAAHNLGWKLAWVLRGWAGESLLDTYETERRPVGAMAARRSLERGPRTLHDALSWDLDVEYASSAIAAGGGRRLQHAWVRHARRQVSALDLVGSRLTLITGRVGTPWATAAGSLADREGLPVTPAVSGADFADGDGAFSTRYGLTEGGAVLVRPDGYVAWLSPRLAADPLPSLRSAIFAAVGRADSGLALAG